MRMLDQRSQQAVDLAADPPPISGDALARQRDLHMLMFSLAGLPQRRIAAYFGVHYSTVSRRINAIPAPAREHYARRLSRNGFPAATEALK